MNASVNAQTSPLKDAVVVGMSLLCEQWLAAKEAEKAAIERRRTLDDQIAQVIAHGLEGTTTAVFGSYTVKVTGKLTRELDPEKVATLDAQIPAALLNRVITYKPALDLREYRYMQDHEPEYFQALASAVTTKPAKPTIAITIKEP